MLERSSSEMHRLVQQVYAAAECLDEPSQLFERLLYAVPRPTLDTFAHDNLAGGPGSKT